MPVTEVMCVIAIMYSIHIYITYLYLSSLQVKLLPDDMLPVDLFWTVASWPAHRFFRRQVRWPGIPISWRIFQFVVIHTVKDYCAVSKAEVDGFLEFSCFFNDVGNLISGSFAFSKSSLNIWKFSVHVQLKPRLENFEHYFASNCEVVWAFFGIAFLWDWNENCLSQSCSHCRVFQICWHIECRTWIVSSFRIWNNSAGIPSPLLALFMWWFLRPIWPCTLGCLALGEWSHHHGFLGHEDLFCTSLLCILATSS